MDDKAVGVFTMMPFAHTEFFIWGASCLYIRAASQNLHVGPGTSSLIV